MANENIPRVSFEVQMGIFTGGTTKLFFTGNSLKNKPGLPLKISFSYALCI